MTQTINLMKPVSNPLKRMSVTLMCGTLLLPVVGQDCKYYEHESRKERHCRKLANRWLKENHAQYGFAAKLPMHRFELDYDEGNMDDLRVYCDYKRGRLDEENIVSADSASRLEQRLDVELSYRLKLLEKKTPISEKHWMFELYEGFEWHVIEFHLDVNNLRLLRVEYITDAYERKIITISS